MSRGDERPEPPSLDAVIAYLRAVLPDTGLNARPQVTAWYVASHYDPDEGYAEVSVPELAREMRIDRWKVRQNIRRLGGTGIWELDTVGDGSRPTRYLFPAATDHEPVR